MPAAGICRGLSRLRAEGRKERGKHASAEILECLSSRRRVGDILGEFIEIELVHVVSLPLAERFFHSSTHVFSGLRKTSIGTCSSLRRPSFATP
jgi:hypothetical protein